jgi:hypothetical protein
MGAQRSVPADGQFHVLVEPQGEDKGLEVAIARNKRQVCLRKITDPSQSIVMSVDDWREFVKNMRAGSAAQKSGGSSH